VSTPQLLKFAQFFQLLEDPELIVQIQAWRFVNHPSFRRLPEEHKLAVQTFVVCVVENSCFDMHGDIVELKRAAYNTYSKDFVRPDSEKVLILQRMLENYHKILVPEKNCLSGLLLDIIKVNSLQATENVYSECAESLTFLVSQLEKSYGELKTKINNERPSCLVLCRFKTITNALIIFLKQFFLLNLQTCLRTSNTGFLNSFVVGWDLEDVLVQLFSCWVQFCISLHPTKIFPSDLSSILNILKPVSAKQRTAALTSFKFCNLTRRQSTIV
jgi:hypothetical protein